MRHEVRGWGSGQRRMERRREQGELYRSEEDTEATTQRWTAHREQLAEYKAEVAESRAALDHHKNEAAASKQDLCDAINHLIRSRREVQIVHDEKNTYLAVLNECKMCLGTVSQEVVAMKVTKEEYTSELSQLKLHISAKLTEKQALEQEVARLTATTSDPRVAAALAEARIVRRRQD